MKTVSENVKHIEIIKILFSFG